MIVTWHVDLAAALEIGNNKCSTWRRRYISHSDDNCCSDYSHLFALFADTLDMMPSSNGNIFRVAVQLCGKFHRWRVNPPLKGQWRVALMFFLIGTWINGWVNSGVAGDLRRHSAHYDVAVMFGEGDCVRNSRCHAKISSSNQCQARDGRKGNARQINCQEISHPGSEMFWQPTTRCGS